MATSSDVATEAPWFEIADIWCSILRNASSLQCQIIARYNRSARKAYQLWCKELQYYRPDCVPFKAQRELAKAVLQGGKYHVFSHPPGWGKTLAAVATAVQVSRTLVLAPPGILTQLMQEFERTVLSTVQLFEYKGATLPAIDTSVAKRIVFASSKLQWQSAKHATLLAQSWDLLIVDEGKNVSRLPVERFPKVVILNATLKKKEALDRHGAPLELTYHNDICEGESLPVELQFNYPPIEIIEIGSRLSTEEQNTLEKSLTLPWVGTAMAFTSTAEVEGFNSRDEQMRRGRYPPFESVVADWPRYAEEMLIAYATNMAMALHVQYFVQSFLRPDDRVLYLTGGEISETVGVSTDDVDGDTVSAQTFNALQHWQQSGQQWCTLPKSVGARPRAPCRI